MPESPLRAARVREPFAPAIETPVDSVDTVLAATVGDAPRLIAEVKQLLDPDAAPHSLILRTLITLVDDASVDSVRTEVHQRRTACVEGRVISHYRLEALLGAGGMGVVYRARDLALGRMVALKLLPDVFTADLRERLFLEADASSRLQHPAIATYYDSGDVGGTAFIAMEFVPGETLRCRLRDGPIAVGTAVAWTACVLEALGHAHAAGILHRDIKPENIMVTGPQSARLLDFVQVAGDYARRAIESDPSSAEAFNWLGYAHLRLGRLDEAYDTWMTAIGLDSSLFFPYYFAGGIGHLVGKADDGLRLMQRAVELEPHASFPIWGLACLHMQMGNYEEALWSFERAAVVDRAGQGPQWSGGGGYHAECLRRVGKLDQARARCLTALDEVEKSDLMYRDSHRAICLVTLGRTALQQGDTSTARAAYRQAIAHVHGRRHTLAGGWLVVQALVGLARAGGGMSAYTEGLRLYRQRDRFDFSWLWLCTDDNTLMDLSRAAGALGMPKESELLRQTAAHKGSIEAQRGLP